MRLRPGDRLFLCSDGVLESRDAGGRFYPLLDRLPGLSEAAGPDPARLAALVRADLARFCPDVRDDVTMLVLAPSPAARP